MAKTPSPMTLDQIRRAACALERAVGNYPNDDELTPRLLAWIDQYRSAAADLATRAGHDAATLRRVAGPAPGDGIEPAGYRLLVTASLVAARRRLSHLQREEERDAA